MPRSLYFLNPRWSRVSRVAVRKIVLTRGRFAGAMNAVGVFSADTVHERSNKGLEYVSHLKAHPLLAGGHRRAADRTGPGWRGANSRGLQNRRIRPRLPGLH